MRTRSWWTAARPRRCAWVKSGRCSTSSRSRLRRARRGEGAAARGGRGDAPRAPHRRPAEADGRDRGRAGRRPRVALAAASRGHRRRHQPASPSGRAAAIRRRRLALRPRGDLLVRARAPRNLRGPGAAPRLLSRGRRVPRAVRRRAHRSRSPPRRARACGVRRRCHDRALPGGRSDPGRAGGVRRPLPHHAPAGKTRRERCVLRLGERRHLLLRPRGAAVRLRARAAGFRPRPVPGDAARRMPPAGEPHHGARHRLRRPGAARGGARGGSPGRPRTGDGGSAMLIARAPLRISFAGGGTDLKAYYAKHGGVVVSATINKYFYVFLSRTSDDAVQITSSDFRTFERRAAGEELSPEGDLGYLKAILHEFGVRRGLAVFTASEIPPGTGLGSSSTVAVALIKALATLCQRRATKQEVAELASYIEIGKLGRPIGLQDQFAASFGGLNAIEFRAGRTVVRPLELPLHVRDHLERSLLLFYTGASRNAATILKEQRASSQGQDATVIESLNGIKRDAEVARDALRAGDVRQIGQILHQSWQRKKRLAKGISNERIDW